MRWVVTENFLWGEHDAVDPIVGKTIEVLKVSVHRSSNRLDLNLFIFRLKTLKGI